MDVHPMLLQDGYAVVSEQEPDDENQGVGKNSGYGGAKTPWSKLNQTWFWEFGGFLLALLCLAATVALLCVYDNQLVPRWPVTLNVALSLLGNIAFTGTLFSVHAALAQFKWICIVERSRPLAEFAAFQNARGGAVGAIQLLFATGAQFSVFTGSLAIVMGMVWGPFTQNLIRYELGNITATDGIALVSRSVVYNGHGTPIQYSNKAWWPDHHFPIYHNTPLLYAVRGRQLNERCDLLGNYPDPFINLDIMSALITAPINDGNLPMFLCSTGDCTWAPFATLGVCSQCTDMTSQIELKCEIDETSKEYYNIVNHDPQNCTATLPGGTVGPIFISTDRSSEILMNITRVWERDRVKESDALRFHSPRMLPPYNLGGTTRPVVILANLSATECSLRLCVLSLKASVRGGIYSETVLDTFTEPPPSDRDWISHKLQPPWGIDRGIDPDADLVFGLSGTVESDWGNGRSDLGLAFDNIPGYAETVDGHTGIQFLSGSGGDELIEVPMTRYIFNANYTAQDCGSPNADTFACAMGGVAAAMTKTFRNSGVNANGTSISNAFLVSGNSSLVSGRADAVATFVHVQWHWILLPCTVWGLGVITWVVVAFHTRRLRLPTWRDNSLPLLFLYREGDDRPSEKGYAGPRTPLHEEFLSTDDYSTWAHERVAGRINVQLGKVPSHSGGMMRLVPMEKESPVLSP